MENLNTVTTNNNIPFIRIMEETKNQWLKPAEAAAILGISPSTIHRLVQRGELTGHKIGKLLKFRPAEIEEYLKRTRTDQK